MQEERKEQIAQNVNTSDTVIKKRDMRQVIESSIDLTQQIKINYKHEDYPLDCIPVAISKQLLLARYVFDFATDGYKVFRIKDILSIKRGEVEAYHDFVMREEEVLLNDKFIADLEIISWQSILESLKTLEVLIDVSTEDQSDTEKTFFVGKPLCVESGFLLLNEVDVFGRWVEENTKIPLVAITGISFKTRYLNMLQKYPQTKQ
jgi:hypothetical protein